MTQMMFYERPVALNRERHKALRLAPADSHFAFAAKTNAVPVASFCNGAPYLSSRAGLPGLRSSSAGTAIDCINTCCPNTCQLAVEPAICCRSQAI